MVSNTGRKVVAGFIRREALVVFSTILLAACSPKFRHQRQLASATNANNPPGSSATLLVFTSEPSGTENSGTALGAQPVVSVEDGSGELLSTATNTITLAAYTNDACTIAAGGSFAATTNPLDASSGMASFTGVTYTGTAGAIYLGASASGLTAACSSAIVIDAGAVAQLAFTVEPSLTEFSGVALSTQPIVSVEDASGNVVTSASNAITLAAYTNSTCSVAAPGSLTATTNPLNATSGVSSFAAVTYTGLDGTIYIGASATGLSSTCSSAIILGAGTANKLAFTTEPSATESSGTALATQPVVSVEDASGNVVATASNAITLAAYTNSTCTVAASGSLTATTNPLNATSGVSSFAAVTYTGLDGTIYIGASTSGLTSACSSAIVLSGSGSASKIVFTTEPSSTATSGTALSTQPVVSVEDASGNVVSTATNSITLAAYTNSTCTVAASGSLTATTNPLNATSGVSSFAAVTYTGLDGTIYIGASTSGLTSACSSAIVLSGSGSASKIIFTTEPSSTATSGTALATQPVVSVEDASGNVVATASNAITLAAYTNSTCTVAASGSLTATTNPLNATSGVSSFAAVTYTGLDGTIYIGASTSGLTSACSSAIVLTGSASKIVFTTEPSSTATSGTALATQPVLSVEDASGNVVSTATNSITLAAYTNSTCTVAASGSLTATSNPLNATSGVSSFNAVTYTGITGTIYIGASASDLTSACSSAVTVGVGTATQLVFTTQPPTYSPAGNTVSPSPVVTVEDASGNIVSTDSSTVTLTLYTNSLCTTAATATVSGNTQAASSGVATLSSYVISTGGTFYVGASDGSLTPACSSGTVTTAFQLVFTTQPSTSVVTGADLAQGPVVTIETMEGATITTGALASATITLSDSSGNGLLAGTRSVTASSGVATFPNNNLAFEKGGTKTITAKTTFSPFSAVTATSSSITASIPAPSTISAFSGPNSPYGYVNDSTGTASATVRFGQIDGIVYDGSTYIYIADHDNCVIRRYNTSTGAVTTFAGIYMDCNDVDGAAGTGAMQEPEYLEIDGTNLYVTESDTSAVRAINLSTQAITTIAGSLSAGGHVDNTTGTNARFNEPGMLRRVGTTLYIVDSDNSSACYIRAMSTTSPYAVTTFAGNGTCATLNESSGNPKTAEFNGIYSIWSDATYLYVSDLNYIRRVNFSTGNVDTLFDTGSYNLAMAIVGSNIYFPIRYWNGIYSIPTSGGALTEVVGNSTGNDWSDGIGTAGAESVFYPVQYAVVGTKIYFPDDTNAALRYLDTSTGGLTTVTGGDWIGDSYGGNTGTNLTARFSQPGELASDGNNLYVSSYQDGGDLFSVSLASGTLGNSTDNVTGGSIFGVGLVTDGTNLFTDTQYWGNAISETPIGTLTPSTYAGNGALGGTDGSLASAEFYWPSSLATDGTYIYVADYGSIRKIDPVAGTVSTLAGVTNSPGCTNGTGTSAQIGSNMQMTYLSGSLYIIDGCFGYAVRAVNVSTGVVTTYAGNGTEGYVDGTLANAEFSHADWTMSPPESGSGITSDGVDLYVLDAENAAIRKISTGSGTVSTLVTNGVQGDVDGGVTATFGGTGTGGIGLLSRTIYYGFGKLYISGDRNIRVVQ